MLSILGYIIDSSRPLREYFIDGKDEIILKLMLNCFNAVRKVFPDEYLNAKGNVLWKTTGFSAIMKSFPELYREGEKRHDLTEDFFENAFSKVKVLLENKGVSLTGENFGGGGKQIQQQLAQIIIEAVMTV